MKISKTLLVIIIIVVILLVATIINFQSLKIRNITNPGIETRLTSLSYSIENVGISIEKLSMQNAISGNNYNQDFSKGQFLLMIMSSKSCNICQWQELNFIKKYKQDLKDFLKIKYIYLGTNRIEALQFNKSLMRKDTLYTSVEKILYELNSSLKYPYFIYIKDGKTLDYHFPIPSDTVFSKLFYLRLQNKNKF